MAALGAWHPKNWPVHVEWKPVLDAFWRSAEGERLSQFVSARLSGGAVVYPAHPLWALQLTPLSAVRVVILGQDPYHGPGQAQGLSFSVADGVKFPPSLRNIFKELQRDLNQVVPMSGSLESWAKRGVLLLNTSFTVEYGLPASHAKRGWESLSDAILQEVALKAPACVYMLWGGHAQAKAGLIESATNQTTAPDFLGLRETSDLAAGSGVLAGGFSAVVETQTQFQAQNEAQVSAARQAFILKANHPSPLSALRPPVPFIGCGHFSAAQDWLAARGLDLDWSL
jgi:uracil-DNA glycosylase